MNQEEINEIISEFDKNTQEIKSIPENEIDSVMKYYESVKETLLNEI